MESIGGMVGHILISELVKKARSFLGGQHELHSDVKDKLERLGQLLLDLQCVIQVTEGMGIQNPAIGQRLKEFKTLAYQIDNLLDTFEYRELEWKSSSRTVKGLRKIGNVVMPKLEFSELKKVVNKLEELYSPMKYFVELVVLHQQSPQRSITPQLPTGTPRNNEHSFVGRKEEKEKIINFLLNTESHSTTNVPILPILGAGGIGKTALAQEVYNDENVKRHFSLKMWLSSDKFLLVLDNVWSETLIEVSDMVRACAPLCHQNEGSKILFTSREEEIAGLTKHEEIIKLKGLRDDEYRSFFLKCAFGDANLSEHPKLEAIGKQIACKLNGSPLAAKTVGELLKDKLREDHWRNILNSDILEQKQDNHDIMPALRLSYLYLPFQLKQCFSYLCVTPKAWKLFQNKVISMWMAHSMVYHDDHGKRVEDVGEDYFKMLISKSFFQETTKEDVYILHDLLHDLAENTYKGYSFRIEDDEVEQIPRTVQHLSVSTNGLVILQENASVLNNLRTLFFLHNYNVNLDDANLHDVLSKLKSIRVLSLSYCRMERKRGNLSGLIHLRYLDLSHSGIKQLPDGVTKLYLLQILDLSQLDLDQVPAKMNKLINLRSLICSGKILSMVAGIGKMARLQELKCPFSVQVVPRFDIGQLGDLEELRGCLSIRNLENVDSGKQAKEAKLCKKKNLVELELHWGPVERNTNPEVQNEILEGLKPPGELKKLCIDGYKGTRSPSWMVDIKGLTNLVSLKLIDCKAWENLPPLGQLLQLQVLEISRMHAIKKIHHGIHGSSILKRFPSLQELIFDSLPEWKVWSADDEVHLFPCLQILRISGCPKLRRIPPLPPTLQRLELLNVGLGKFPKLLTKAWNLPSSSSLPSSLVILTIKGCQQLQYPSEWLIEQHESLRNLEELTVDYCDEFAPELVETIGMLTGLKKFSVDDGGLLLES
ncbi:putative disease resistance protein RGA3 [Typha latifolia]|uniref:putative disease resistance protein RGA3 n=1 Tax=Typha latifolia TaxID=4733 RepID=UPI003C2D5A84